MYRPAKDRCKPSGCDYLTVSKAAGHLMSQACTLGARHIKDGTLRIQFIREVSYYVQTITNDVTQGKQSAQQGLNIQSEQNTLASQSLEVAHKGVGVVAGVFQLTTGAGICYGSAGTLYLFAGAPLMAHGANNIYENGRNLLENRHHTQGPTRKIYQIIAKSLGGGNIEGNMAYGIVDLALSAYGLGRMVLKPDARRLFRYVDSDYIRAYKTTGKNALIFEATSDALTGRSLYLEHKNND